MKNQRCIFAADFGPTYCLLQSESASRSVFSLPFLHKYLHLGAAPNFPICARIVLLLANAELSQIGHSVTNLEAYGNLDDQNFTGGSLVFVDLEI